MMSEEEELSRVYTINLSKVVLAPHRRRTKRVINMIKEFATRHMKAEEVKIDEELNQYMWKRGIRHPPRRLRVKMTKDEDDIVTVSRYSEEVKEAEEKAAEAAVTPAMALEKAVEEKVEAPEVEVSEVKAEPEVVEKKPKEKVKEEVEAGSEQEGEKVVLSEEELEELMAEGAVEQVEEKAEKKEKKSRKNKEVAAEESE
jgi:large subunit ribosomal protein L31e